LASVVKIKRGLQENVASLSLDLGELALATDTGNVYVGADEGVVWVNPYKSNDTEWLMKRPHLWTVNAEIDFGGGLYGIRKTGSITVSANTDVGVALLTATAPLLISVVGGWWCKGGGNLQKYHIMYTLGSTTLGAWDHSLLGSVGNEIRWGSRTRWARTAGNADSAYDIAFTYVRG
jgi:hypothetical protein